MAARGDLEKRVRQLEYRVIGGSIALVILLAFGGLELFNARKHLDDLKASIDRTKKDVDAYVENKKNEFNSFVLVKKKEFESSVREAKSLDRLEAVEKRIKTLGIAYSGDCRWIEIGYEKSHGEGGAWGTKSEEGAFLVELDFQGTWKGAPKPDPANYPIVGKAKFCRP